MNRFIKKATIVLTLVSVTMVTFADRGAGKKSKVRTALNINTATVSLKASILNNIKNGLTYKGSLLTSRKILNNTIVSSSLMTYQKGNTTYIIPYKNKITVPEMKQGYAGLKLIIRSKK
ncbi:MAG: hypothetical protein IPP72_10240 [Chitinophagaceae bacterium]|nr:hypothetical protein [Chitinophagaceae bacterium]